MIRYIKHSYIDRKKYDRCVELDASRLIYGFSWYLDVVCESWDTLVLNDYDAVWPLPVRRKFGIKYFYRPYGIQQLGVFSKKNLNPECYDDFLRVLKKNCSYTDIYANEEQNFLNSPKVAYRNNKNYTLRLDRTYQEIYKGYSQNTRRNLKKSDAVKWQIFEHDSPDVLIGLFKKNRGVSLNLNDKFYDVMSRIMFKSLHINRGHIWTLYTDGNELCAGIFILENRGRQILLFSGNSDLAMKKGGMVYLLNEYIIHQCGKKYLLDFEGSNNEGLSRFYAGFGADMSIYKNIQYNNLSLLFKWLK